jgi:hypothetical protein
MTNSSRKDKSNKWYENPIKRSFAILSGFIFIASIGYSVALVQKNLEFKLEKFELRQEYNQKLQDEIYKCEKEKQELENKRVEKLENAILELQNLYNEK